MFNNLKKFLFIATTMTCFISNAYAYHFAVCYNSNHKVIQQYQCCHNMFWKTDLWITGSGPCNYIGAVPGSNCPVDSGEIFNSTSTIKEDCVTIGGEQVDYFVPLQKSK